MLQHKVEFSVEQEAMMVVVAILAMDMVVVVDPRLRGQYARCV
jgi:hypothetical protein